MGADTQDLTQKLAARPKTWVDHALNELSVTEFLQAGSPFALSKKMHQFLYLQASGDEGVIRNGGRRGSKDAPRTLLNVLRKMAVHQETWDYFAIEVCEAALERADFSLAQQKQATSLAQVLGHLPLPALKKSLVVHMGGGHDHVYPLLLALEKAGHKKITVLNIDAHADTRLDSWEHSGNPFRLFADQTQGSFQLYQIGLHTYANDKRIFAPFPSRDPKSPSFMKTFFTQELNQRKALHNQSAADFWREFLQQEISWEQDRTYLLSIDTDALHSSFMEAVSAVNPQGFSFEDIFEMGKTYLTQIRQWENARPLIGLYEYNPRFENLSLKGAKSLSALLYEWSFLYA